MRSKVSDKKKRLETSKEKKKEGKKEGKKRGRGVQAPHKLVRQECGLVLSEEGKEEILVCDMSWYLGWMCAN
jgi:hypothetical protein